MHILTLTSLFPNALQPLNAVFVRARMENFTRKYGHKWTVVAPVPYFPRLPFKVNGTYDLLARVPAYEDSRGYPVHHPRYLVTPRFGMANYGKWMAAGVRKTVRALHREHPIDYIDGHYVYPDGTAAAAMGRELGIPVVISARGTDLNLYSRMPPIVPLIQANLEGCRTLVCVCSALKDEALRLGMPAGKIRVIGNGVDTSLFRRADRAESRRRLGIPEGKTVFLSVGHMTERKGFHLILEAFSRLGREDKFLAIAGDGPQRGELESLAAKRNLGGKILFPGAVPNQELPAWYSAADFFVLASSREGWPNVVCEAQAIGLPVIATKVWGIPEIVTDEKLGVLVEERSPDRLLEAMERSLAIAWDRGHIEKVGQARTWDNVSEELVEVFAR